MSFLLIIRICHDCVLVPYLCYFQNILRVARCWRRKGYKKNPPVWLCSSYWTTYPQTPYVCSMRYQHSCLEKWELRWQVTHVATEYLAYSSPKSILSHRGEDQRLQKNSENIFSSSRNWTYEKGGYRKVKAIMDWLRFQSCFLQCSQQKPILWLSSLTACHWHFFNFVRKLWILGL